MQARPVTADNLPTILAWWRERDEGDMPDGILPPVGVTVYDHLGPAAAAWLYQPAGVPLGIIDWMVTRPGLDQHIAREACRLVLHELEDISRALGFLRMFASVTRPGMLREAVSCGFNVVAPEAIHLSKNL